MTVNIDEAWRDRETGHINMCISPCAAEIADRSYPVAPDSHIGNDCRHSGAAVDIATFKDDVKRLLLRACAQRQKRNKTRPERSVPGKAQ